MNTKVILQQGNDLQLKVEIDFCALSPDKDTLTFTSPERTCGAVNFQLQALSTRYSNNSGIIKYQVIIFVRFLKLFIDNLQYTCIFKSKDPEEQHFIISDHGIWYKTFMYNTNNVTPGYTPYSFDVSFSSDLACRIGPLASLHDDTDTTDFKLCGDGGSVEVHKLVLMACSPVLQTMLKGEWKETSEGQVTVADATKETLEHFKDYIYLNTLPSAGFEQLLLIGSFFMMPDLVQKCIVKLLNNWNNDNFMGLLEFAITYKVSNLLLVLLKIIRRGVVNINRLTVAADNLNEMCQQTNAILNLKNK